MEKRIKLILNLLVLHGTGRYDLLPIITTVLNVGFLRNYVFTALLKIAFLTKSVISLEVLVHSSKKSCSHDHQVISYSSYCFW